MEKVKGLLANYYEMKQPVYLTAENIVSPLGTTAAENFTRLKEGVSGIRLHNKPDYSPVPFHASLIDNDFSEEPRSCTRFERLLITSISNAVSGTAMPVTGSDTILIISSTKGNISLLETQEADEALKKQMTLSYSANKVAGYFGFIHKPIVVSHACISGLVAIITAMRLLQAGRYRHAVVAGADVITQFVLSGFQSFHAVSDEPCRPFDADRKGINLGEGAATIVLSLDNPGGSSVQVLGGAISNDANHISGPSRTGAELYQAIAGAVKEAGIDKRDIDCISAHGTATLYNDEMEAKAVNLAGLQNVPLHSIKGYYGHTLGAAGLIETVVSALSLKEKVFLPTKGYSRPGTTQHVKLSSILQRGNFNTCLKVASGFGGCNAALILQHIQ